MMDSGRAVRYLSLLLLLVGVCFGASGWHQRQARVVWKEALKAVATDPRDDQQALDLYRSVAPRLSWHPGFLGDYARSLRNLGQHAEAVQLLEKATARRAFPALLEELAAARARMGDHHGAIEAAREASQIFPWRLTSKWQLASFYQKLGEEDEFYRHVRQLLVTPMKVDSNKGVQLKQRGRALISRQPVTDAWRSTIRETLDLVDPQSQDRVARALRLAGGNRGQISAAISLIPEAYRPAMVFLVTNMPETDLIQLTSDFLINDVKTAMQGRGLFPFAREVPDEIFLRYVVPYAQLGESRQEWRRRMREQIAPGLKGLRTSREAAQRIAETLLALYDVRYEEAFEFNARTPFESSTLGHADCVGGAILLGDAFRSVSIPARVVAIPQWVDDRVGHAWTEVYEQGRWQPVGIFDLSDTVGWFVKKAAQTDPSSPRHRIYAASFERTDVCLSLYGAGVWWHDITNDYLKSPQPLQGIESTQEGPTG